MGKCRQYTEKRLRQAGERGESDGWSTLERAGDTGLKNAWRERGAVSRVHRSVQRRRSVCQRGFICSQWRSEESNVMSERGSDPERADADDKSEPTARSCRVRR